MKTYIKLISALSSPKYWVTLICVSACARTLNAQTVNAQQQVVLQGLRSSSFHGSFTAAKFASDGTLFLLLDENDGIRILKTDSTATNVLAQAQAGSTGDSALSMAIDPSGNIYITGTTTSVTLTGTSGVAFPTRADTSTNSFLAKYDTNLNLIFLTFLGAGRTAAASVAATSDAAFVTGITFSAAFPVSTSGIQQAPATGSSENGFVERFNSSGSSLVYATYLTGANGNTVPTAIVADSSDNAYITGSTSASGYPTIAALQSSILGTNSGLLTKLNPSGSAFVFSTFLAGQGLSGLALDPATNSLLLTGNIALGQFPVATVTAPLTSASYQTLLRIPVDGQSLTSSVLLVPGSQSFVTVGTNGDAWISGALTTPLFPAAPPPDYTAGDSFLLHLTATNTFDQTLRFGGITANNASYASLTSSVVAPAVAASGTIVMLPGTVLVAMSSSLLPTQRFDLPSVQAPNTVLPNLLSDIVPTAASCGTNSQCTGTGAFLSTVSTSVSTPALSLSSDDLPNLTLRNLGSATANGLSISAGGFTLTSNCGATLAPSNQCSLALTGTGPGTLTVSAANASTTTISLPANTVSPDTIVLSTSQLDFGIETSTSPSALQTITVSNLSTTSQTFTSAKDGIVSNAGATFAEISSDCISGGATGIHVLTANSSCHITLGLTISSSSTNDGPVRATWKIGPRDIVLTGFAQASALNVSATEVDFGTQLSGSTAPYLPRYLYLSNNSTTAIPHSVAMLPGGSPFSVLDACPSTLEPHTVCRLTLGYLSSTAPSSDAVTLNLDQGLSVLVTGQTLPPAGATGSSANPNLSVSSTSLLFTTPVVVTGVSSTTQSLTVQNTGASPFALRIALTGDFTLTNGCPASLAGGASCTLIASFAPSQPGARDGILSLTAGNGFAPTYVSLSGVGTVILPANNGTLDLGQTLVGEPAVGWYKIQQPLAILTAATGSTQFAVVLVPETGSGHGTLPASSFNPTATSNCNNCWLGVQFLSQTAGAQAASLTLSSAAGGNPYLLTAVGVALPVQGLLLTPITQDFGPVSVNSSSVPFTFTLSNLLASSIAVTVVSVTTTGDFAITANGSGGSSCSGTVPFTASCFVQVVFSPTVTGPRTGTLTLVTSGGTVTTSLSGYGATDSGLAINPTSLTFANEPGSAATQQSIMLSNTGSATLAIGVPVVSNPSFSVSTSCSMLAPGTLCNVAVTFAPQTATVVATLSIPVTVTLNGQTTTSSYSVPLTAGYTSEDAGLQILSSEINFGSTTTASLGPTRQLTINNLTAKALKMTLVLPRQFPLAMQSPCATLPAGGSCSFAVSFLPVTGGALTGTVFASGVATDGSTTVQALTYMLGYGAGSGKLTITGGNIPYAPITFGQVTSGQTSQQIMTMTNSGTGTLNIRRVTSDPPFLSTTTCGIALAPSSSCSVTLTYAPIFELSLSTPGTSRSDAGTLIVESDAVSSPDTVDLSGVAIPVLSTNPVSSSVLATVDVSEGSLTFANTQIGSVSSAQAVTFTNTGTITVHVFSTVTSTDFNSTTTCATILPGTACTFSVQFAPTAGSSATLRSGTLEILSDAGTSMEFVSLVGTASASTIALNPAALDFGTVNVGASETLTVSVTNTSATAVTFLGVNGSGDYAGAQGTCPANGATLAAGSSCVLNVTFAPSKTGTRTGTLSLSTDATQIPLTVSLTGVGVLAQLQVTPGALSFGNIAVGASANLTLTLLNTGTATVTSLGNSISGANAADFAVTSPCSVTALAPNQGCTEVVTFTPSAVGARGASLAVASSDPSGPALVVLTGTGVQGGMFVLTVNGASSATATVKSGYPATYPLTLTPLNGFSGDVALTCTPTVTPQYASCSLLATTLTLNAGVQTSTVTINTITAKVAGMLLGVLLAPLAFAGRRRLRRGRIAALILVVGVFAGSALTGCGKGPSSVSDLRYTPAGTYQYTVTASATSGASQSSTVTLNLIVQ